MMGDHLRTKALLLKNSWGAVLAACLALLMGTDPSCAQDGRSAGAASGVQKPNIILIFADDLGAQQVGYESDFYETPNLDRLARQGMTFTRAYTAAAVCSPTRASLMTGEHPARLHTTNWIPGHPFPYARLQEPDWQEYLPLDEITIAEALKEEGYRTAHLGKWHLSQAKTPPESRSHNPDKQGFDDTFVTYKPKPEVKRPWQTAEDDPHNIDTLTTRALQFIERNQDRPFYLQVSHNAVHEPLIEGEKAIEEFQQKSGMKQLKNNPAIAAILKRLDASTGRIMDKIGELGLKENTLFIFYSDNGGVPMFARQTPYRKGKGWLYEGGVRVPLVIRWPGRVEEGSTSSAMVTSTDFFPTFVRTAGGQLPQADAIDGMNLIPELTGRGSLGRETLYWHYPHYHAFSSAQPSGAVRSGRYKLIEWFEESLTGSVRQVELYDLQEDPSERMDLSKKLPEKAEELQKQLHEWRERVGAQMPTINPDYHHLDFGLPTAE